METAAIMAVMFACALPVLSSCSKKEPSSKTPDVIQDQGQNKFLTLKQHLQQKPDDAEAWYDMADLYYQNSLFGKAAEAYKKAAKLDPEGYTYLKLGMSYDAINQPRQAAAAYEQAVKLMPSYAVAYNNLGAAYGKLGKSGKEIAAFEKAIKLRSHYATARYNLGYAYLKKGDKRSAMKQYEALENIDQGMAENLIEKIKSPKSLSAAAGQ